MPALDVYALTAQRDRAMIEQCAATFTSVEEPWFGARWP